MGNTGSLIAKNDDVVVKKTYTKVALTEELKRRAMEQHPRRLIGVASSDIIPSYSGQSQTTDVIRWEHTVSLAGRTHLMSSRNESGKSIALKQYVLNHIGNMGAALYINVENDSDIVKALQKVLNTTCDSCDIVDALLAALGSRGAAAEKGRESVLVLDNVDPADPTTSSREATFSFIQQFIQSIGIDDYRVVCIIASEKIPDVLGGFHVETTWEWTAHEIDWRDVEWKVPQLEALLGMDFPGINCDFHFGEKTPGEAFSLLQNELRSSELKNMAI